jgi:hypothetical protein
MLSEPQAPYYLERISEGFVYSLKFTVFFHVTMLGNEWPTLKALLAIFLALRLCQHFTVRCLHYEIPEIAAQVCDITVRFDIYDPVYCVHKGNLI